jgi:integrase
VKGLKKGRSTAKEPRAVKPVADDAVDAVLLLVSPPIRAMIEFQRLTGARSGEVCVMRPCDIDRSGDVWVYRPMRHKNEHRENAQAREIFIGPKAKGVLEPLLKRETTTFVFSPREARAERFKKLRETRKTKVQPSQVNRKKTHPKKKLGERYNVKSYYHAVRKACRKANIAPWHPHQLRHSAATAFRHEFGVETTLILLGHSTAFTTEIYAERDRGSATEAAKKMS